eukprot:comp11399_c0_seq1/m.5778 comp11399_c0_seq1/g.5778  ORF comp11399_c0_seq1/g.5778 comp11399_c0_seq1/m.5778 type:complete len:322 (-) comp11399_c0_seq1:783-1748(-)
MLNIKDFLQEHTLAELVAHKRNLVTIDAQASIEDALETLERHNVSCLPVVEGTEMQGMVTTLDLLAYVAFASFGYQEEPTAAELQDFKHANTLVKDLIGMGEEIKAGVKESGLFMFEDTTTVREIFDPMTIGIQRVLVQTQGDYRMLTQSDLLHFLYLHEPRLADYSRQPIGDLGLGSTPAKTVGVTTKTLHALRELYVEDSVDALAVVDGGGKLVATLSSLNVNGLTNRNILDALLPVGEFLRKRNYGQIVPAVYITKDQDLSTAMAKCILGGSYRVWVVDDQRKPIGQITIEDILVKFGPFPFRRISYADTKRLLGSAM